MAQLAAKSGSNLWPLILVGGLLIAGVMLRPRSNGGSSTPQPLPPLMAEGWLNADGPPQIEGQIVVLDAWFSTCSPCLASLPKMAKLHEAYAADPRVTFVGLTFESEQMLPHVQEVIDRVDGFDWPVGYGASPTLDMLGVRMYPTLIVFDSTGMSVWTGHDIGEMHRQLQKLL